MQNFPCRSRSRRISLQCGFFHALSNHQGMQKLFCSADAVRGFISSVGSFMHFQISTGRKSSFAVMAVEGFLLSVASFINFKSLLDETASLQSCQLKGFSPVWVLLCTLKYSQDAIIFCNGCSKRVFHLQFGFFNELSNFHLTKNLCCSCGS